MTLETAQKHHQYDGGTVRQRRHDSSRCFIAPVFFQSELKRVSSPDQWKDDGKLSDVLNECAESVGFSDNQRSQESGKST